MYEGPEHQKKLLIPHVLFFIILVSGITKENQSTSESKEFMTFYYTHLNEIVGVTNREMFKHEKMCQM